MSGWTEIALDEVVHFDVTTHVFATGAVSDADSPPTFDVFEEATDTPIIDDTSMTKRTSLTGNYRGTFTASAANGFEVGKWYNIIVSATVSSVAAKECVGTFRLRPAEALAGHPKVDVGGWLGTAPATPTVNGVPEVDLTHINGAAQTATLDDIEAQTDDIGAAGAGLTALATQASVDDLSARLPDALTSDGNIKADALAISGEPESADRLERSTLAIVLGTCDAGGTTTSIVASALSPTSGVNDQFNGRIVTFDKDTTTAALRGQATDITDYTHATLTFAVTALTTAPQSGDTFTIT